MNAMTAERLLAAAGIDMIMDLLAVMMALRILRVRICPLRVCFAAFFGVLSAFAVRLLRLPLPAAAMLWLPFAALMMRLGGGKRGLRAALTLLSCMGFLGGTVLAFMGATGSPAVSYLLCGGCAAAVFVGTLRAACASYDVCRVRVECVIAGRRLAFDAIADSGNSLRDYLTHRPVIVAAGQLADEFGAEALRTRPIFADTAGGRQMMRLLIPQETVVFLSGKRKNVEAALAFSPGLGKTAPALVPASLLRGDG